MDLQKITVTISNSNEKLKCLEEEYEGSLSSLVAALKKIKNETNGYLTELVEEEKSAAPSQSEKFKPKNNFEKGEDEESDIELEEDFIDTEIKKELSVHGDSSLSSDNASRYEKRTRSSNRSNKRIKN